MSVALAEANPRVVLGDNQPPEPTPFEAIKVHIEDLLTEARNWADGAKVESQAQADAVSRLIDDLRKAEAAAEKQRVEEKAPWDEKIEEIQARFNAYIAPLKNKVPGKVLLAMEALKKTLKPYLDAMETERLAEVERARLAAVEAQRVAAEAARAAAPEDLAAREEAEDLIASAVQLTADANRIEKSRSHANGGERAMGLTKTYTPEMIAPGEALRHYAVERNAELKEFLLGLAKADVREGKRQIPGFKIVEGTRI